MGVPHADRDGGDGLSDRGNGMTFVIINSIVMLIAYILMAVGAYKAAGFCVLMAVVLSAAYVVGTTWGDKHG